MRRAAAASVPPHPGGAARGGYDSGEDGEVDVSHFRQRLGFLGLVGIAFTGCVFLMAVLREVIEPFMWALFLVIALQPLTALFEWICLGIGSCCCCRAPPAGQRHCPLQAPSRTPELDLGAGAEAESGLPADGAASAQPRVASPRFGVGGGLTGDMWHLPSDDEDVGSLCSSCCACLSRIIAVMGALVVVVGIGFGMSMFVLDGATRLKDDFDIYERGAHATVAKVKALSARLFGGLPPAVVDQISDQALANAKAIVSDLAGELFAHAGKLLVEFLMLGLYSMFWLCTPMPLNSKTECIFRRYLFLKGSACLCYGLCVGLMLHTLDVALAALFGLMSFCFSFIPEVGVFFAMLLVAPVILFDSRLEAPFLTLLVATLGQLALKFVFANIIEVKLVENDATMKMHPVVTLLAVTFYGLLWGPTGMLLSVPLMTYLKVVILSDNVPSSYRDPLLILLEGDRQAPKRHRRRRAAEAQSAEAERLRRLSGSQRATPPRTSTPRDAQSLTGRAVAARTTAL